MGVKSTVDLTREQAEEKYIELRLVRVKRQLKAEAVLFSNHELETIIEQMSDSANEGEGFENYNIVD